MLATRRFSTASVCRAAKPAKGKAPPKKASKQSFAKKNKNKDAAGGPTTTSAFAAKIGSSKATTKLNDAAPKIPLPMLSPQACTAEQVGTMFETPSSVVTQLQSLDVLQRQGGYQYFSQLASVLRGPSVELANIMAQDGSSKDRRILLDGPAGSGKTIATTQAITLALQQKWIVITIPHAESLVDSTYPYAKDETRQSWRQDVYMSELLHRVAEANKAVLQLQNTSKSFNFDRHQVPQKSTLHKLLEIGAQDPVIAHDVFDAFMAEVNMDGRPKVLLTLDNFSIATMPTRYRDPSYEVVHPFDLEIIKNFVAYLNGTKVLTNGVVLTNTSSLPKCVPRALQLALGHSKQSPFESIDERIADSIAGVQVFKIGEYSPAEAKSVVQHYASAGLLRGYGASDVTDSLVKQRMMMGGSLGRDVFRSCLKQI